MAKRILIIEDNARLAGMVRLLLERSGFSVSMADNCRQALVVLAGEVPDLVLLDLNLPDGSGVELMKQLTQTHGLPVVILSAATGALDKIRESAAAVIKKPFVPDELVSTVTSLLREPGVPPYA